MPLDGRLYMESDKYRNFTSLPTQEDFETIPDEPKGHVVTAAKQDKKWRPHQSGGVIVAEPDAMTLARERGEDVDNTQAR